MAELPNGSAGEVSPRGTEKELVSMSGGAEMKVWLER
jgi:hypothetical protein